MRHITLQGGRFQLAKVILKLRGLHGCLFCLPKELTDGGNQLSHDWLRDLIQLVVLAWENSLMDDA